MDREKMYIVKLSNQKMNLSDMCKNMSLTEKEVKCVMLGYQQAIDFLCALMDEG